MWFKYAGQQTRPTPISPSFKESQLKQAPVPHPKNNTVHKWLIVPTEDSFSGINSAETVISNDPTAGSPTVTLLRLLVPLNDQV